ALVVTDTRLSIVSDFLRKERNDWAVRASRFPPTGQAFFGPHQKRLQRSFFLSTHDELNFDIAWYFVSNERVKRYFRDSILHVDKTCIPSRFE
ncbi:unnamed protein product, partial [Ectocarpus sp. 13 AM-2016]